MSRPMIICARCGKSRHHNARGMCRPCFNQESAARRLGDWERKTRPLAELAADYRILADRGQAVDQIAGTLGYRRVNTLRVAVAKAVRTGLLPRTYLAGLWRGQDWRGEPLCPREKRLLTLTARGVTEVAAELGLKRSTLSVYKYRIRHKLGVSTWDDAVRAFVAEAVIAA